MADVSGEVADARNVLLAAPSMSGEESTVCSDLLVPDDPGGASVLWVSFRRGASACREQWDEATDEAPADAAVVLVGDAMDDSGEGIEIEQVSTPSDLTGLGIKIGQFLSTWEGEVVVCVDSLTAMLQYVDVETAYEFLHAITGQLYAADARAHFHIDPTAHDDRTVDAISSLFDAVVTLHVDGSDPDIRKRQLLRP